MTAKGNGASGLHDGQEPDAAISALFDLLADMDEADLVLSQAGLQSGNSSCGAWSGISDAQLSTRFYGLAVERIVARWMEQEERVGPHRKDWEMMVYCLLSSGTLAEALDRLIGFQEIVATRGGIVERAMIGSSLEIRLNSRSRVATRLAIAVETIAVANIYGLFCWLTKKALPLQDLAFGFPRQLEKYALPGILPVPHRFGAPQTAFRIPSRCLELPIVRNSAEVGEIFSRRLLQSDVMSARDDVCAEVRRLIASNLLTSRTIISLSDIADSIGCSVSTLRRRLADHDLSYRQIKDGCRREIAEHILEHEEATVEEVAGRLAFCDSDAFRAAFKEWTGQSPTEFRRLVRQDRQNEPSFH